MRLTLINQFYTPDISPTAHLCASLAEHRANQGDQVTVLTSRAGYVAGVGAGDAPSAVRVRRLWSTEFGSRSKLGRLMDWMTFYLPAFWAAITLPSQDVIVCMTTPPFIAMAGWLHKLLNPGARLVLWNMDVYPEALERTHLVRPRGPVSQIMRAANRALFSRLDYLITLDLAMEDLLLSQYMPANRQVRHGIIPNWERLNLFPARSSPLKSWGTDSVPTSLSGSDVAEISEGDRQAPHSTAPRPNPSSQIVPPWTGAIPDLIRGQFVVLYLGNAGFGHEFQTLIDAAKMLRDVPVRFVFVGGGALRPWIEAQCERHALGNILLCAYVPKEQTPAVMARADCALITLENSMLGVMSPSKLHANLAMGLPVIYAGPERGNVDQAIGRFKCGISLRPGNAEGLAKFVRELAGNPQMHASLRERAREAFEREYCDQKSLAKWDEVLEKLFQ